MNSIDLAVRQANARNDLPFKLEFISETDDSKPAAGVAAIQKLCADKSVLAVSAHWNSPVAMATGPFFDSCGMVNLVAGAAANGITKQGWKAVGRVNAPFRYAFPALAKVAYDDLGLRKIAIIHSLDDFGTETANEFTDEFTKLGGQIIFRDGYNVGDRDFTSIITKMRSARPEAVMHGGVSTEAALIVRQMRQLGMKQPYLGHSGFQTVAYVQAVGDIGDGTIVASLAPFPEDLPGGKKYLADYKAATFKDPPDVYGVFGYAAGQTLVELVRRYGPDRKAIFDRYREAKDIPTVFGMSWFDADGELQPKKIGISVLEKGEWKKFDSSEYKPKFMK
jgi:branched-chain amino acid transport system substrate-binding protein